MNRDHKGMVKFESREDEDFRTICAHLKIMINGMKGKDLEILGTTRLMGGWSSTEQARLFLDIGGAIEGLY